MFGTTSGASLGATNVRRRVLAPAVKAANEQLAKAGRDALPDGLTAQSAAHVRVDSVRGRRDPATRVGADGAYAASVHARALRQCHEPQHGEPERLRALVNGEDWTATDSQTNVLAIGDRKARAA